MKCKIHGETKFISRSDGYLRCSKCRSESVGRRRRLIKIKAIEYKGGKCERCGYNKCPTAMAFHHKNPDKKDWGISADGDTHSWTKIVKELDKCILLCHNCHAEEHEKLRFEKDPDLYKRLVDFRPQSKKKNNLCINCNKVLSSGAKSKCKNCYQKNRQTKIIWPSIEELVIMSANMSYCKMARILGVSDNAIRKRLRSKN